MKKTMSLALGALILVGSIFYFFNSNNEKENKVLVNTKTETSSQKEEKNTKKTETLKTEVKKENNNPRGPVIYKNTPENEGCIMELKVPEKWAHLDYSRLGQPKEVALKPEDYITTDVSNKKSYLDRDSEKALLNIYNNKDAKKILLRVYDDEYGLKKFEYDNRYLEELEGTDDKRIENEYITLDEFYSDINNLIKINEESGRKEDGRWESLSYALDYVCGGGSGACSFLIDFPVSYKQALLDKNSIVENMTEEEFYIINDLVNDIREYVKMQYHIKGK